YSAIFVAVRPGGRGAAGLSFARIATARGATPCVAREERPMAMGESAVRLNRRAFLGVAGAGTGVAVVGGIPGIVAAQQAPNSPKGTKRNILPWVSCVPASAVEFKRLVGEFGKQAGVDVTADLINMNDLNPRIASAIETKSGPDIIMMISNWPHLYAYGLADVDDVAKDLRKRAGGASDIMLPLSGAGTTC